MLPRHPAEPSRRSRGEEPGQAPEPLHKVGLGSFRTHIAMAQNRSVRLLLLDVVNPPEIISIQDVVFERPQHRPNLDPFMTAGVK
jgi:hypothetical protein